MLGLRLGAADAALLPEGNGLRLHCRLGRGDGVAGPILRGFHRAAGEPIHLEHVAALVVDALEVFVSFLDFLLRLVVRAAALALRLGCRRRKCEQDGCDRYESSVHCCLPGLLLSAATIPDCPSSTATRPRSR